MNDDEDERDDFLKSPPPAPDAPDVQIIEDIPGGQYQGVRIKARDGGYAIESMRDHPVIDYDRRRYRLERDPASSEQVERFRIIPKGQTR